MAQRTITVRQVIGDENFECPLQLDTLGDADITFVMEVLSSYLRYFNQRAIADENLSDEAARNLRLYTPEETTGKTQHAFTVAGRIRFIEEAIREDPVLDEESTSLAERCLQGNTAGQEGTDGQALNLRVAYDFVKDVFQELFSREEIANSTIRTLAFRFMLLLEFCYQLCKKITSALTSSVTAKAAVGFVCMIAGYFARYLWQKNIYNELKRLGDWAQSQVMVYVPNDAKLMIGIVAGVISIAAFYSYFKSS